MKKHKKHEEHENGEAWLLPYSDLMTLLLAVFIVLFAVSQVDETKARAMAEAFAGVTGVPVIVTGGAGLAPSISENMFDSIPPLFVPPENQNTTTNEGTADNPKVMDGGQVDSLTRIEGELTTYFQEKGIEADVSMRIDERGLVISLSNRILFNSGSADIMPDTRTLLIGVGDTVSKIDNYIRVEGHTDNVPINSARFPTNWELSTARATSVVRMFATDCGIPFEKMVAVGYAENRPIADNSTIEGRAQNRRVDIIVLNTKYNSLEDQRQDVPVIQQDITIDGVFNGN